MAKKTTHECLSVDIRNWQREKMLYPGAQFIVPWKVTPRAFLRQEDQSYTVEFGVLVSEYSVMLVFVASGEERKQQIEISETETNFGIRKWLVCSGCDKRTALLYLNNNYFACRKCHDLNYRSSQLQGSMAYYHHQLRKLSHKLGEEYNPASNMPPALKPKGMHWRTYEKHRQRYENLVIMRLRSFLGEAKRVKGFPQNCGD